MEEPVSNTEPVMEPVERGENPIETPKAKQGGAGWKVATLVFAILAVLGCGAAGYLYFTQPKKAETQTIDEIDIDSLKAKLDLRDDEVFKVKASGLTKDNKYFYVVENTYIEDMDGAWSYTLWFREAVKGSEWKELSTFGDTVRDPLCSEMTEEQLNFINNYSYLNDEIGSKMVYCADYDTGALLSELTDALGGILPSYDQFGQTKDKKYFYVIFKEKPFTGIIDADVEEALKEEDEESLDLAKSYKEITLWVRKNADGAKWKKFYEFTVPKTDISCIDMNSEVWEFLDTYSYIDEDIKAHTEDCQLDY